MVSDDSILTQKLRKDYDELKVKYARVEAELARRDMQEKESASRSSTKLKRLQPTLQGSRWEAPSAEMSSNRAPADLSRLRGDYEIEGGGDGISR